jgi:uncharacterized oxidoreductase
MAFCNGHGSGKGVAPWGGREARLHTAPISIAVPMDRERCVLLDFGTSVSAEGKLRIARNSGKSVPEGYIIDAEGNPSTDPNAFYGPPRGALLPFGGPVGYKGYGLAIMAEILGGILSGAGASRAEPVRFGNALLITAMSVESFMPLGVFREQVRGFLEYVKATPLAPGFQEINYPGELEARERSRRLRDGILVDEGTWARIKETATGLGVDLQDLEGT